MSTLIITCGMPGCGKSTWAALQDNVTVVSSDAIRQDLTGDITDQRRNGEVFDIFHQGISDCLAHSRTVIADSTALDKFARDKLRQIADERGAVLILALWANPLEAISRNADRERMVPEDVMRRMADKLAATILSLDDEQYLYDQVLWMS